VSRVHDINHVPIVGREVWCDKAVQFMKWIYDLVLAGRVSGRDFFDSYSSRWTEFEREAFQPTPYFQTTFARENLGRYMKEPRPEEKL